jgi:tetratricopeptide (TPR) repeat protein
MRTTPSGFTKQWPLCFMLLSLVLTLGPSSLSSQDEESLGRQAEHSGKLREALTHYVAALQNAPDRSDTDQRLREKVIALAQKIRPTPAVSELARRPFVMGNTYMKDVKAQQDYSQAISEYKKALLAAPWFGDAYHNLGIALEAAGNYAESEKMLKLYLETKPSVSDARTVQDRIYEVEAKLNEQQVAQRGAEEKRQAAEQAQRAQARAEQERRDRLSWLVGTWKLKEEQYEPGFGVVWTMWGTFEFALKDHTVEGYVMTRTRRSDFGRAAHDMNDTRQFLELNGELQGEDPSAIRWTNHFEDVFPCPNSGRWGSWLQVSLTVNYNKNRITFSLPTATMASQGCEERTISYELTR